MRGLFNALALAIVVCCTCFPLWADGAPMYAPRPITRPHQQSIELDVSWDDFIQFEFNRGPQAVSYLDRVLEFLDPENVASQLSFGSFKNTRLTMSSFEVRSQEVLSAVEILLQRGVQLRLVMDAAYIYPLEMPSDEEWESWGPRQKAYFVKAFDKNADGKVDFADIRRVNEERKLAIGSWQKLLAFQQKYPGQVELIHPPHEVIPSRDELNYPRIHHMKNLSLQFRKTARHSWGDPSFAWVTSANFTETGLSRRVLNPEEYLMGEKPRYDPQSEGQIQFGASFWAQDETSKRAVQALLGRLENWIEVYKNGKTFDSLPPDELQPPRVVFKDGSTLQAFFSEGLQLSGKEALDPIWVISKILYRKDIQLTTYYDAQFVFTHTGVSRLLRTVLNFHKPERFALMVDSSQALEPWSAIPSLVYAPYRRESYGVYPGRAIESYEALSPELDWQNNIRVYRGGSPLRDLNNDKLHLKARYFEYIDALGVTHYVTLWGSANSSHNASKLSADVYYLFQSTDPKVGEIMRPFFESLKNDPRMQTYSTAYLERYFFENFFETKKIRSAAYLKRWESFLNRNSQRRSFESLVDILDLAGASTPMGKRMLRLLQWHLRYNGKISAFNWEDLELIIHLSQDGAQFSSDFLDELSARWTMDVRRGQTQRGARASLAHIFKVLTAELPSVEIDNPADPRQRARAQVHQNCRDFLAIVKGKSDFKRQRYPIVESKSRRRPKKT